MEFLEDIIDLDVEVRTWKWVQRSQGSTMAGVSFIEGASSLAPCCFQIASLQFSRVVLSFTSSHQLGLSLIWLESAHIRSSTIWWSDIENSWRL